MYSYWQHGKNNYLKLPRRFAIGRGKDGYTKPAELTINPARGMANQC
jgi:hypothetical protein